MRRVFWAGAARDDLRTTFLYISKRNLAAARKVRAALIKATLDPGEMPTGRLGRVTGTFEKVLPRLPYLIAYEERTMPDGEEIIVILRVVHGARDWREDEWPE